MGILEEKLTEAIDKKSHDITTFIWKGGKTLDKDKKYRQSEKRLVDMHQPELSRCYEHCKTMLFNQDTQNPGRYLVLEIIADQKDRCGAELSLRYFEQEKDLSRFTLMGMMSGFLSNNREAFQTKKPLLNDMFSGTPNEFESLSLNLIMDGCLDRLGALNKKHLTRTFILRQGIWLTSAESKELLEYNPDKTIKDRLDVVRDHLNIKEVERLYINSKGLDYTQMRAMLNLKPNKKYVDLTTVQLETLRNKVLFSLEETVNNHIRSWERRMDEIETVAEHKGFKLY